MSGRMNTNNTDTNTNNEDQSNELEGMGIREETLQTITKNVATKTFMSCKPNEFHGKECVVELLSWIKSMEYVLHISKCPDNSKVEYTTCLLQGRALTWWNTEVQTYGREAALRLT
ncbi:hypothetical protein Tco_0467981 [Tanacetum coccineum]